jgi:tetratricopeptide (TPR) repeat protein
MSNKCFFLLLLLCIPLFGNGQSLMPTAPDYNAPYDTLIARGDKSYFTGKMLGVQSPGLAMMFYNRAIEINKDRHEAFSKKAYAYMEYKLLDDAIENFTTCLEISPSDPECLYGMFYTSFMGSTKYNIDEVPKPMMNQIYNSAVAFLAVAPATMPKEKAEAKILGYTFKLAMDNNEVFKKYNANNIDNPKEENIKVLEEILPAVQATNNAAVTAGIYDKLIGFYINKDDFAKVKDLAPKAIATGQAYTSTYYYLAYTQYNQDHNAVEADKTIEAGLKIGPHKGMSSLRRQMQYEEGKKAYLAKDYPKAIAQFSKYNETNPDNERANAWLGFAQFATKKYADAAKSLKMVKKNAYPEIVKIYYPNLDALIAFAEKPGPTAPAIQTTLAEAEKQEDIVEKAVALYEEGKYPESTALLAGPQAYYEQTKNPVSLAYVYLNIAYNYHNSKEYEKAKEFYKKSIEQGGFEINSFNNLGLLLYAVDKNYADAEKILNDGIARHPDSESLPERLGKMYASRADEAFDKKEYSAAATDYEKATSLYQNAEVFVFLGFSYYYLQNNEKCLEAIENAVYLNPDIGDTYPAVNQLLSSLK